jgi:hypothetical protein
MTPDRQASSAANELDEMLTPTELLRALTRTLSEEMAALRNLVDDEDADCLSRDLRAERLAVYEYVLRLFRQAERWEW